MVAPVTFGYDSVKINGVTARGVRPLMTVLIQSASTPFEPSHTPQHYRELLFGTSDRPTPCVAGAGGLYQQNSGGQFYFSDAGVLGPFTSAEDPLPADEAGTGRMLGEALAHAAASSADFARYDTNGDGVVGDEDLAFLVVLAGRTDDHLLSSDPAWAGSVGDVRPPDYRYEGLVGHIYDPNKPQPALTVPCYQWWSKERLDSFTTTNPAWSGAVKTMPPDYTFVRLQGYLSTPEDAGFGNVGLYNWYSRTRGDNYSTTDPTLDGTGVRPPPDYQFAGLQGYVFSAAAEPVPGTVPLHSWYGGRRPSLGGNRLPSPASCQAGSVRLAPARMIAVYETVPTSTLAHELGHRIGYHYEHYGADNRVNWDYSLMSGTDSDLDTRESLGHDAWYKMKLGWLAPQIMTTRTRTSKGLWASVLPHDERHPQSWLVYDPDRGQHEFFLLEYRNGSLTRPAGGIALNSWWSSGRGDNHASADTTWAGRSGDRRDGYTFTSVLGYLQPHAGEDAVALHHWWSPSREDNFLTTHPDWAGTVVGSPPPDYQHVGIAGYVHQHSVFGRTVPLHSWWSPSREDNYLTTDPAWVGLAGDTKAPDYHYVRLEGHIDVGSELNYDGDPWHTGRTSMPDAGLAIWRINTDPAMNLLTVPASSPNIPNGKDSAIYLIPPQGTPGHPNPGKGLWTTSDGTAAPTWLDGTPSGLTVTVRQGDANSLMLWIELKGN